MPQIYTLAEFPDLIAKNGGMIRMFVDVGIDPEHAPAELADEIKALNLGRDPGRRDARRHRAGLQRAEGVEGARGVCLMDDRETIGARVRSARYVRGVSQQTLADAMGMHRTAISDIETGNRNVTAVELLVLARELGRSVSWIVGEERPATAHDEVLALVVAQLPAERRQTVLRFAQFMAAETGGTR